MEQIHPIREDFEQKPNLCTKENWALKQGVFVAQNREQKPGILSNFLKSDQ